jgi:hypothetical protein
MAVISALNFASVARLKKTWEKVSSKAMLQYQEFEVGSGADIVNNEIQIAPPPALLLPPTKPERHGPQRQL